MQKISSFHQFILEIQQILKFHDVKTTSIFDHKYPKTSNSVNDWNNITHKSAFNALFLVCCKNIMNFLFWYFEHVWLLPLKTIMRTCRSFDVYLHAKNELHY